MLCLMERLLSLAKSVDGPAQWIPERREPSPTAPSSLSGFRPDVEGLRAVAVALVVLYHAGVPGLPAGFIGVDVFFVVSGFVITRLLVREFSNTGRISLRSFFARRARRILPAAVLVTGVTVMASYLLLGPISAAFTAQDAEWTSLYSGNFRFALAGTSYLDSQRPPSPLQHMWSLGVEEQFYLVWPILLVLAALGAKAVRNMRIRATIVLVAVCVASFAWSAVETQLNGTWAFFSPLTRAGELGVGALTAVVTFGLRRSHSAVALGLAVAGLCGIIGSAVLFTPQTPWPGTAVLVPSLGTALVVLGGCLDDRGPVRRLLGVAPLRWVGSRSYSIYLWHWPVLIIAAEYFEVERLPLSWSLPLIALSLALAEISYRLVENPIRSWTWLNARPLVSISLGVTLSLSTFVAMAIVATS
jgi:peptidoglycan/LPS O-acetylase OafA/YrhL